MFHVGVEFWEQDRQRKGKVGLEVVKIWNSLSEWTGATQEGERE